MASNERRSSSTAVGWLGKMSRSMSATLLCAVRPAQAERGLELAHLTGGYLNQRPISSSGSAVVPGLSRHSAGPAIAQPEDDASAAYTAPAPVEISATSRYAKVGSSAAAPAAAAAADSGRAQAACAGTDVDMVETPGSRAPLADRTALGQHLGVQHPLHETLVQAASLASSGERLPSALDTPSFGHTRQISDTELSPPQPEQSVEHLPRDEQHLLTAVEQPERAQKVRWLLGMKSGKSRTATDKAAVTEPSAGDSQASRQPVVIQNSQAAGSSSSNRSASSGASASLSEKHPSDKHVSKLPPSGNAQLDKYLNYLLSGAHPHSFMYYPSWGMSEDGCAAIGEFLRRDRRIKVVTLSENSIRDEGCELLAEGLAANKTLSTLDLSGNKISDSGAVALAEALHLNSTLKELKLSNNKIGDEGAEALAAAFAGNSTLRRMHLSGNPMSAAQKQVVDHVLKTKVYKMPNKQTAQKIKKSPFHLRKHSSLQFHIELTDCEDVLKASARHRLPPADVVAALTSPSNALENSLAMQVAHLLAELAVTSGQQHAPDADCSRSDAVGFARSQTAPSKAGSDSSSSSSELVLSLALRLAWRGYEVAVRTSVPSADVVHITQLSGSEGLAGGPDGSVAGLKHTFLRVVQPGLDTDESPAVVIDPYFREQFKIAHMTDRYRSVLDALPKVLVLAEARLYHLVEALSNEMAQAFQESGMTCPPWRDVQVLLEKWLCISPLDVVVDSDATLGSLTVALAGQQQQKK